MSSKLHSPDVALSPSPALDLGALPEWRLQDLYEDMDSPRFAADLERAHAVGPQYVEHQETARACGQCGEAEERDAAPERLEAEPLFMRGLAAGLLLAPQGIGA